MADISRDPKDVAIDGHSEPLATFGTKPKAGDTVSIGSNPGNTASWEVLRVDDVAVHLVRTDRAASLKAEHRRLRLRDNGVPS